MGGLGFRPKPAYGQPCNSCGLCCVMEQCPVSRALFGARSVCPAIEREGDAFHCGVVRNPALHIEVPDWAAETFGAAIALMLGAGIGCDGVAPEEKKPTAETVARMRVASFAAIDAAPADVRMLLAVLTGNPAHAEGVK